MRMLTKEEARKARELWRKGNGAGKGYEVGSADDDVNEVGPALGELHSEDFELVYQSNSGGEIAVYFSNSGTYVGVGNAYGPWAVTLDGMDEDD